MRGPVAGQKEDNILSIFPPAQEKSRKAAQHPVLSQPSLKRVLEKGEAEDKADDNDKTQWDRPLSLGDESVPIPCEGGWANKRSKVDGTLIPEAQEFITAEGMHEEEYGQKQWSTGPSIHGENGQEQVAEEAVKTNDLPSTLNPNAEEFNSTSGPAEFQRSRLESSENTSTSGPAEFKRSRLESSETNSTSGPPEFKISRLKSSETNSTSGPAEFQRSRLESSENTSTSGPAEFKRSRLESSETNSTSGPPEFKISRLKSSETNSTSGPAEFQRSRLESSETTSTSGPAEFKRSRLESSETIRLRGRLNFKKVV